MHRNDLCESLRCSRTEYTFAFRGLNTFFFFWPFIKQVLKLHRSYSAAMRLYSHVLSAWLTWISLKLTSKSIFAWTSLNGNGISHSHCADRSALPLSPFLHFCWPQYTFALAVLACQWSKEVSSQCPLNHVLHRPKVSPFVCYSTFHRCISACSVCNDNIYTLLFWA